MTILQSGLRTDTTLRLEALHPVRVKFHD